MENNLTDKNFNTGDAATIAFIDVHKTNHPDCYYVKTYHKSNANKFGHIDLLVIFPIGYVSTFDVKDNMKYNRNGDLCFVIELQNNFGYKGSLYGRQHQFAVKHKNCDDIFYSINRDRLQKYVDSKVNDETPFVNSLNDATYKKYKRDYDGKDDIITLVPLDDITNLLTQLIRQDDTI